MKLTILSILALCASVFAADASTAKAGHSAVESVATRATADAVTSVKVLSVARDSAAAAAAAITSTSVRIVAQPSVGTGSAVVVGPSATVTSTPLSYYSGSASMSYGSASVSSTKAPNSGAGSLQATGAFAAMGVAALAMLAL